MPALPCVTVKKEKFLKVRLATCEEDVEFQCSLVS